MRAKNRIIIFQFVALLVLCLMPCAAAVAAEPSTEPILRLETGMHTAMIGRIGVDDANHWLVTASKDKTVRLWELPSGRLIRVLRPPVGKGDEGKIYSVAISPDGRQIACGGWTKLGSDSGHTIYLFDRATGHLTHRITDIPNAIFHLAYSPHFLVACLGMARGIRIYKTSDLSLVVEDKNYGNYSLDASFSPDSRLVTSSFDGYLRLYSRDFQLLAKKKAPGGGQPVSVSFSPDGRAIAVGFGDSTKVDVLSALDLSHLYSPDTSGINKGSLGSVSWSADGRILYAGGIYNDDKSFPIFAWADVGRGRRTSLLGASNTIMDIHPLKDGGFAYGAVDPAWGVYDKTGQRALFITSATADYRANPKGFLVSDDGTRVRFGYEERGKVPAQFNVEARLLEVEPAGNTSLFRPVFESPRLRITDWEHTYTPKLNGTPLKLKQYEISRSLAIAPDSQSFLLGTEWYLRLFDRQGNETWNVPVPGTAWAVNIAANGKVAVAALGDGTIRWYRLTNGKELLALFPHKDRKRWVIWSPSGYYDASPGAEELIGWHINRGKDQEADFFPASRFRSTRYRPDVIARILETQDEAGAIRLADEASGRKHEQQALETLLPPVVTILSPSDGSSVSRPEITLSFSVRSPSGDPVTSIRAMVDGRPISTQRGIAVKGKEEAQQQIQVTIPERDSEVSIIAENRNAASEPSTIRLRWKGKSVRDGFVIKPTLYILAIGVGNYQDQSLKLGFPAKDAQDFARAMQNQRGGLYRDVTVRVLADQKATRDNIMDGLEWIQKETTSKDIAMVFLAGHGVNDPAGIYYYLPVNANTDKLKRTGISFTDIKNTVTSLAGKAVLFVDTCHSGNVMGTRRGTANITAVVNELASAENGVVVFASSTGRQYSLEDPSWGNGAFTKALVEGVSGRADYQGCGRITVNMLDLYLSERVKELTGGRQTPTTTKPQTIADFPVAVKR